MADDADRADKRIADVISDAVAVASRLANQPTMYHKECNWCGDPTEGGARYCSRDCASDAFKYETNLKRNGIRHDTDND